LAESASIENDMEKDKEAVRAFWQEAACGDIYAVGATPKDRFAAHSHARYGLEPYIRSFARFDGEGKEVLEVGVGMGADHVEWASSHPSRLVGIDLTEMAVDQANERMALAMHASELLVADAENLPFADDRFDIVYSWGVLHHTPNTERAFAEVHRVLRPGGQARIMIYHRPSFVGLMLWLRFGLFAGRPLRTQADLYSHHLESPGTKGYTLREARELVSNYASSFVRSQVSFGDLLQGEVGRQHDGGILRAAKRVWPRWLVKRIPSLGLMLLIDAKKSGAV